MTTSIATPETVLMDAVQALLLADATVAALIGEQVFDEVPSDASPGQPPLIWFGPINRQRLEPNGDDAGQYPVRMRLYAESVDFGRREVWAIVDAAALALEGAELDLPAPFDAADIVRVVQAGDVLDETGVCKTAFLDISTTIERDLG